MGHSDDSYAVWLYHAPQMHAYVISHGQHVLEDIVRGLAAGACAFFYAATPASSLGTRPPHSLRCHQVQLMY